MSEVPTLRSLCDSGHRAAEMTLWLDAKNLPVYNSYDAHLEFEPPSDGVETLAIVIQLVPF